MFIDTHCHLASSPLAENLPEVIAAAHAVGVSNFIVPATQPSDWQNVLNLNTRDEVVAVAVGLHPWFVEEDDAFLLSLQGILCAFPNTWVGEIGLDALAHTAFERQLWAFEQQVMLAQTHQRPLIVHNVRATASIVATLKRLKWQGVGIIHAFSGSMEEANALMKLGFKIGLGSLLLNPKAKKVQILAKQLPLSGLVLETDSPFMLPNQSNTPAHLRQIAQIIAQLRGITEMELAMQVQKNVAELLLSI